MMTTDTLILGDFNAHHSAWYSSSPDTRGTLLENVVSGSNVGILNWDSLTRLEPWKKRACRGPATITRLPSLFINQFFHNIKLLQPYDVCRHQPDPFYGPDCYICEH